MTTIVISYGLFFFEEKRLAKQQLRRAYQAARAIRQAATVPPVASCQHHIRKKAISQAGTLAEGIAFCFWAEGEGSGQSLIMRTIFICNEAKYSQLAAYRKQVEGVSSCDAVQRIVTQGYLAQFLAFGVKPVRAPYWEMESPHVKDLTAGIADIGQIDGSSVEKILALNLDLIVTVGGDKAERAISQNRADNRHPLWHLP
ncbi:hypothetical protein [Brevibacillus parabrevis]|uniref:hypothetical protein n=1 Tax=Brevibacillus parabrevis TaxID=54914 RepID=UPI002E1C6A36|nr:hypothetical protein [Brevibacillus parabrevis]